MFERLSENLQILFTLCIIFGKIVILSATFLKIYVEAICGTSRRRVAKNPFGSTKIHFEK